MFNPSQIKINNQSTVGTTVHSLQTLLDRTETDSYHCCVNKSFHANCYRNLANYR
jgi:hypothetical protein